MISSEFLDPSFLGFALDRVNEAVILVEKTARVCYANQKACEILNYSNSDPDPLFIYEIDPAFPLERWNAHWKALKKAKKLTFETNILTKGRPALPIEVSSSYYKFADSEFEFVIFRDISERKEALNKLRSANDYHRGLIETTLDPLAVVDTQGIITDVNKAMEAVTGLTRSELLGTHFAPYFKDPQSATNDFAAILSTSALISKLVYLKNKNGQQIPLLLNANTLLNENGQITGVFIACKDISERLKIETELKLQNERYRNAQAIGHVGNWEYDVQTTEFWGSDEAKAIYGLNAQEGIFSTDQIESCIPDRQRVHQALLDLIEQDKPYNLEFEIHPHNSATPKIISSVAVLHKDAQGVPVKVTGVVQDVTERNHLQEQANRLAEIVRTSEEAIIGKAPNGLITSWNLGAQKIFGFSESEILGKPITILIPDRFLNEYVQNNSNLARGNKVEIFEAKRKCKDGHEVFLNITISPIFDSSGKLIASSVIAHEVTKQKIERMINGARAHLIEFSLTHDLNLLLEETINEIERLTESQIGFFHLVDEEQKLLTLRNWSSRTKAEFCKMQERPAQYPIETAGVWTECFYQRKPVIQNDLASLPNLKGTPSGHPKVSRELVVPILRGNKIVGVLGVGNKQTNYDEVDSLIASSLADLAWEITEYKRSQEDLQELNQKLESRVIERTIQLKQLNEDLQAFAYSVSHDLRAPLRQIKSFTHLLQEELQSAPNEQIARYIHNIGGITNHMGNLIDDLLAFSQMNQQAVTSRPLNLRLLIDDVLHEFESEIAARKVKLDIQELPVLNADPGMIRVVLSNLISNALKFTRTKKSAKIVIGSTHSQNKTAIFIRDNGVGFDMHYYDQLFAVFQRLHSSQEFEGTGIGLATVKRIIERHGGEVWAESKVGQGATFFFSLPESKSA